jgi:hypothetical protein
VKPAVSKRLVQCLVGLKPDSDLSPVGLGLLVGVCFADVATNFMNQLSC